MKYAIIRIKGRQYKVEEGQVFLVDKLEGKPEAEVLLVVNDSNVSVGKPVLSKAKVTFEVITQVEKGKKVVALTFKAKSRHRRKVGFRPQYTRLKVKTITS